MVRLVNELVHGLLLIGSVSGFGLPPPGSRAPVLYSQRSPVAIVACAPATDNEAAAVAKPPPIDPKDAIEELGKLTEQIKVLWTDGKTWDAETRTEKRRAIVETYVRVFAPAIAFSGSQLAITLVAFVTILIVLNVSGLGFDALQEATAGVPLLGDVLAQVGPGWGNAAIAFLLVELCAPVLIPAALLVTPKATEALSNKLDEWGLDADGLNAKIEKVLADTS